MPELLGLSPHVSVIALISACFVTSTLAAIAGLGGGMLLIAVMPFFVPAAAVIPIHGVAQLASNSSRALFTSATIQVSLVPGFLLGSVCGVAVFSMLVLVFSADLLLITVGAYILVSQWSSRFVHLLKGIEKIEVMGFFQTGLGVIVGATGPLTTALMVKQAYSKNQIVASNALFMAISHSFKIILFLLLGFAYLDYLWIILGVVGGAVCGSWLGTYLRHYISEGLFRILIKYLLTVLAIKLIIFNGYQLL